MSGRAAWRGGLSREQLEPLVEAGWSIARMAVAFDVSATTVRYWLIRYELKTGRSVRLEATKAARIAGARSVRAGCSVHGPEVELIRRDDGGYRCGQCRSDAVVTRRRRVKEILLREAGGACVLCGYDRCVAALQFHHVDPVTKSFAIAGYGMCRSLERTRAEAAKCVLLCANCHAEVENGARQLPSTGSCQQVAGASDPG